jgi:gliding motility-associated lipoprotein GldH
MHHSYRFILLIALSGFIVSGCDSSRVFEDNTAVDQAGWNVKQTIEYDVDINDINTPHNFYLNVRHAEGYPYCNLFVFMRTKLPNGKMARDTIEIMLQDKNGEWTGSGLGDIYDSQTPFKKGLRFPMKGRYHFSIEQGMRTQLLPFIMEIGMRIEKQEE